MATLLRWFSIISFTLALGCVAVLWVSDIQNRLLFTPNHQRLGAFPLILIGIAYISFQLCGKRHLPERAKGILLGLAFLFWGSEQLLPPSVWVTAMDSLVITIFVVDLALMIIEHLKRKDHDLP